MKMKKLLASALAAAMVLSTMVGTVVTSAATTVGTITAGTVNAVAGKTDTITADINIKFTEDVVAPHNIISVALDGYTLSNVALGTVTYAEGSAEGVVTIDADGSNLAAGKILLEAPVDSKAPTVKAIALTATFVDADETDTAVGTYAIVVNADDMTDVNEADIAIDAVNGKLVVAEAVVEPECKHENLTFDSAIPASETESGKLTYICECGETIVKTVLYEKKSSLASPAVACGATTQLIFRITTKNYGTAEAALLTIDHSLFTGETVYENYTHADFEYDASLASNVWAMPVISTNFNDGFVATLYVCRDGQWYSGITRTTSVTEAAMTVIKGTTADNATKVTAANLLKMGSEIQKKFNVNVENLPDAGLVGEYAQYVTTSIPTVEYNDSNYSLASTTAAKEEKKVALSKPSITLSDAMIINMNAVVSYYKDDLGNVKTINDFRAVYTYTAANGASVEDVASYVIDDRGRYVLSIPVPAPNMSAAISVQIFDGATPISDITVCSVESILAVNVEADGTLANLAHAALNYSIASRELA